MKNLVIGLIVAVLGVWSISQAHVAVFIPSVTISQSKVEDYSTTISAFLERYTEDKTDEFLTTRFNTIDSKITTMLRNITLPSDSVFILEYIQFWVNDRLSENE